MLAQGVISHFVIQQLL